MKLPQWVCETHLREIEDLIESGEKSEALEVWTDNRNEWRENCADCSALAVA